MPKRVRARSSRTTPPDNQRTPGECTRNGKASPAASLVELQTVNRYGTCPTCGRRKLYVLAPDPPRYPRSEFGCYICCPPDTEWRERGEWLKEVTAETGIAGSKLVANPFRELDDYLNTGTPGGAIRTRPAPFALDEDAVAGAGLDLLASERALAWLHTRGLNDDTIATYELGYDSTSDAITFPVRDEREALVNVRRRYLSSEPKMMGLPRRPAALYPMVVLGHGPPALVVNEGETDTLLLNQHGIPAVTSTAGTSWKPEWDAYFERRRVAVMYDAGARSYERAERRALALVAAGAKEAWPVDLTLVGFAHGEDVGDWFCKYGWDASALGAFLNESRRWYRADRRTAA